ncbi:MAG: hypothetical protein EYX74_06700 [Desulfobulbaceae bacterium]|nr:MAG: hypothetical protein EYX74_06700 [Desulfobulbaceae bacterium]
MILKFIAEIHRLTPEAGKNMPKKRSTAFALFIPALNDGVFSYVNPTCADKSVVRFGNFFYVP